LGREGSIIMAAAIIAIQVDAKTAKVYAAASPEEQRTI
jgi:hypothetical protein